MREAGRPVLPPFFLYLSQHVIGRVRTMRKLSGYQALEMGAGDMGCGHGGYVGVECRL